MFRIIIFGHISSFLMKIWNLVFFFEILKISDISKSWVDTHEIIEINREAHRPWEVEGADLSSDIEIL